ncbi:MAG: FGGY family carbohydrate kinase, partial [Actinobacteria bacterium]|nr:FGGY family carbohydrate kinase [Actinomycetota bacterium]
MKQNQNKKYIIADFGASNGRVSVGHFSGNSFNLETIYRFGNRQVFVTDRYYWDILKLLDELKTGLILACRKYNDITSIAVDTWGLDFGIIDKKGKLISNPVAYRDKSKFEWSPENLFKKINKNDFYNLTGYFAYNQAAVFYLGKLVDEKSYEITYGKKMLMMPDLFNYFLCGNCASEYTIACGTLMVNCLNKKWESRIINSIGISRDLLPKIVNSGTKVGILMDEVCREIEIKPMSVVAAVGHDTASAIAGTPVVFQNKKWAFLSTGTWLVLGIETIKPVLNIKSLEYLFMNEGGVSGRSFFARNLTGFWIIQKCLEKWEADSGRKISWKEIDEIYPNSTPFKSFINVDDPLFSQNHDNMPKVIQNYCREMKVQVQENMAEICRCIYESLAMSVRYFFDIMCKFYHEKIEFLHLIGGGVNNKLFCQWISNILKIPVYAGPSEATS